MTTSTEVLDDVIGQLDLAVAATQTAYGDVHGLPVTLTVLGDLPLALMFEFRIKEFDVPPPSDLASALSNDKLSISFAKGRAWLSCVDLPAETTCEITRGFAETLTASGLALDPGCLRCGNDDAKIVHVQGNTSRLCAACLDQALADRHDQQRQLERSNVFVLLGLPAVLAIAAIGWAVFWTLVDVGLTSLRIQVIELNRMTILLLLAIGGSGSAAIGLPLGAALRRSGAVRAAPWLLSALIALGVVAGGEVLYAAVLIFRWVGVLDIPGAARILPVFVQLYGEFLVTSKVMVALATTGCCVWTTTQTPVAQVKI